MNRTAGGPLSQTPLSMMCQVHPPGSQCWSESISEPQFHARSWLGPGGPVGAGRNFGGGLVWHTLVFEMKLRLLPLETVYLSSAFPCISQVKSPGLRNEGGNFVLFLSLWSLCLVPSFNPAGLAWCPGQCWGHFFSGGWARECTACARCALITASGSWLFTLDSDLPFPWAF